MKLKDGSFTYILNNILKGYCILSIPKTDVERKCLLPWTELLGKSVHEDSAYIADSAHIADSAIKIVFPMFILNEKVKAFSGNTIGKLWGNWLGKDWSFEAEPLEISYH